MEFKADFHRVYSQAQKGSQQKLFDLSYLTTDDVIEEVIISWLTDWHSSSDLAIVTRKFVEKKKKEATKQKVQQLAQKWKKEVEEKAHVEVEHAVK